MSGLSLLVSVVSLTRTGVLESESYRFSDEQV
jgi:hypothetical protein